MQPSSRDYDPLSGKKEFGYGAAPEARRQDRRVPHVGPIPIAELPASGFGGAPGEESGEWVRFHNLKPRKRSERKAVLDKESLEKARLQQVSLWLYCILCPCMTCFEDNSGAMLFHQSMLHPTNNVSLCSLSLRRELGDLSGTKIQAMLLARLPGPSLPVTCQRASDSSQM